MITFITTIRHPLNSNNFAKVERLFENTLRSICNQSHEDFSVVVVCNAVPNVAFQHPRVTYHLVDYPPPSRLVGARTDMSALQHDKGTKLMAGLLLAQRLNPDYFFFCDADDLVSREIAAFAHARPQTAGWYVDAGYTVNFQSGRIQRKHGLVRYCGSTLLPNAAHLLKLSGATAQLNEHSSQQELLAGTNPGFVEHVLGNHICMVNYFRQHGFAMQPLPFRATAYLLETGENHTANSLALNKGLPIDERFCREFGYDHPGAGAGAITASDYFMEAFCCARSRLGAYLDTRRGFIPLPEILRV